jgi:hypothetical protein
VSDQENDMNNYASLPSGHGRANRGRRDTGLAAVVVCVAAFAAACGGVGRSADLGYVNGTPDSGLAFAQCMRTHGVPNFPDPSGGQVNLSGFNRNSPGFQHAAAICGRPASAGPAQRAQGLAKALAFARCMRAHGLPDFPDPTVRNSSNGSSITIHMSVGSGVDPKSPPFQAAPRVCRSLLPGGGRPGSGKGAG